MRQRGSNVFKVLGATPAGHVSDEEGRQYLAGHGVSVDGVVQMSFPAIGITVTPTLALLDSSGRIVRAWTGRLSDSMESKVIKSVQDICTECEGV